MFDCLAILSYSRGGKMVRIMPPKKSTVEQIFNLHICSVTSEEVIEKLLRLTRMCKTGAASLCPPV